MPLLLGSTFTWLYPLALLACLFAKFYVYAPLKIRRQQIKDINVQYHPIELTNLPPEVTTPFFAAAECLALCGFKALGHVGHHAANIRQESFVSLWMNHSTVDSAQIIGIITQSPVVRSNVISVVTFRTEFTDGTAIVTTNSTSPSCWPADPRLSVIRCRDVHDIALLYRVHRARVDHGRGNRTPTSERMQDPMARMLFEHQDTFTRLIRMGYYAIDEAKLHYVPTCKGAYCMTWRLLPPFKQIQRITTDQRADQTLRQLGFAGLAALQHPQ